MCKTILSAARLAAWLAFFLISQSLSIAQSAPNEPGSYDVVVYGGNSGGAVAAIQSARMGKSVVLIEPGRHLGGMTSSGLGWVDAGNLRTIGGLTREYFHRIWKHYETDAAWKWEKRRKMRGQHSPLPPEDQSMWVLEPSVAESLFNEMLAEAKVTLVRGERLDRKNGVEKKQGRIASIAMESGRIFRAKMFIDATYEGDLMAAAGVSYFVGREPNTRYNETINGVRPLSLLGRTGNQIDPYRVPGDPKSGLLPRVHANPGENSGDGDRGVQAYNYRMCLTKIPENRVAVEKPSNYDEKQYELLFRFIEAGGAADKLFKFDMMPNGKTDSNNNGHISTDFVGMSWDYPEGDYSRREQLAKEHEQWQRGLIWTLQNHPRIPEKIRKFYGPWGLAKDEFTDTGHWPFQLYVREARRMISDYVITENTALGAETVADPVAFGSYHMDSHAIKYLVSPDGFLACEGGMFVRVPSPFGISYRSIIPKKEECENLLVPVCVSASHAAYGSMRMEPVFMVLGQSAATAASLAIDRDVALQDLPYDELKERLQADGQVIDWAPKKESGTPR